MRSSSAAARDSRTDIEDNTPPTGVNDDTTPTGGACDDDVRLSVTGDTVVKARLAVSTEETDAGTLGCASSPGKKAGQLWTA